VEGTDRGELYPFHHLKYCKIGKEESGVSTRELARLQFVTSDFGNRPWSQCCGRSERVELAPSVVRTGELPKGPVDRLEEDFGWKSKEVASTHKRK
jgi:hypothetical protein